MPKTRRKKVPSPLRTVIARNVELRAEVQFPDAKNRVTAIRDKSHPAEREKLTRSNIQDILKARTSASLEQLDKLARALDLLPYQLLLANMDPQNPQVAKGAVPGEDQVYGIKQAVTDAVKDALATTGRISVKKRAKAA
jgi:hypothetical protein